MTTWREFCDAAPDLAALAESRLTAHKHLTMATIRRGGAPRISGTEVTLRSGEMWLAGMNGARRFDDLRRDPRVAVHSASEDADSWTGDAKVAGVVSQTRAPSDFAAFAEDPEQPPATDAFELFRVDITEVVVVRLGEAKDHLVIDSWRADRGRKSFRR
ncbi:MAG TPA: pyridoxamine 5'-phosphate oxidase family protein [Mycobacteriales bacterium]|nr:pyridoxamine 5'-phosphate oxidase family protein [Mycobacteriales bacterium]